MGKQAQRRLVDRLHNDVHTKLVRQEERIREKEQAELSKCTFIPNRSKRVALNASRA
jgi:hypothetical protein